MKKCLDCLTQLREADGRSPRCSACRRERARQRERAYRARPEVARRLKDDAVRRRDARRGNLRPRKLTLEQFDEMVAARDGCCDICKKQAELRVDHDHSTGIVRGLLCHSCNAGIGGLGDTVASVRAAYAYLLGAARRDQGCAEENVVLEVAREKRAGATVYITDEPCTNCQRILAGSGIIRAVWPGGEAFYGVKRLAA